MDVRRADLEDLPPLVLRPLRGLDLDEAAGRQHSPGVTSASGVVRRGDLVYVIGDEMPHLAVFRLSDPAPGRLVRALDAPPSAEGAGDLGRGRASRTSRRSPSSRRSPGRRSVP